MSHRAITDALKPKKRKVTPTGYMTNLPALATRSTFRTIDDVDALFTNTGSRGGHGLSSRGGDYRSGGLSGGLDMSSSALVLLDTPQAHKPPGSRSMSVPLHQQGGGGTPSSNGAVANISAISAVATRSPSRQMKTLSGGANDALPPNPNKSTLAPQIARKLGGIDKFINEELRILATQCETALEGSHQRLSVFQSAAKMLQSALHPDVAQVFERILYEYDLCLHHVEQQNSEHSLMKERKKIEDHYHVHYTQVAAARDKMLSDEKMEFQNTESRILANYKRLENQVASLKDDNERLRRSQHEDHDRMLSMSQAVIESRLAMQKAELWAKESLQEVRQFRTAEAQNFELINDNMDMSKILKQHNIPFDPRCKFAIDSLLGAAR